MINHSTRSILLCAVIALTWFIAPLQAQEKPNILFIFADDMAYDVLGEMNKMDVETPNLDRLAENGTLFTHAYNQGSYSGAVCIASRNMLNTGRFLWNSDRIHDQADEWRKQDKTWSELMKNAGYETYMTGKWHLKINAQKSFDHVRHERPGMPDDTPDAYNRPQKGKEDTWKPWDRSKGGYWEGGTHWSRVLGNDSIKFLDHASDIDRPFFMYLAFNAPHDPRQSPKKFINMYPLDYVRVPENYRPKYPYRKEMQSPWSLRDEKLAPMPRTKYAVKKHRQEYYAIISHMDKQVGRILDALEETGKADNTIICFTADHGLAVGRHGLFGKQNMFEHSLRVPFMINGPGIPEGKRINNRIYLQDVMPTTLDYAGAEKPDHVQFKSVNPLIDGDKRQLHDSIYAGYRSGQRAIIRGRYKLILYPKVPKVLLYDLKEDPLEQNNLADDPKYSDIVDRLFDEFLDMQGPTGDNMDIEKHFPDLGT